MNSQKAKHALVENLIYRYITKVLKLSSISRVYMYLGVRTRKDFVLLSIVLLYAIV